MREKRTVQSSIFDLYCDHEIGLELKAMSEFLDRHVEILDWVSADLQVKGFHGKGRSGLPAESVVRCALLKQMRQLSYKELSFHLCDSASFQAFARLPMGWYPRKSVLQDTISKITPKTWEQINHCVLDEAQRTKIEKASTIRIDSTVTESDIHEPTDSSLLGDSVRVMIRLLKAARRLPGNLRIDFVNHNRCAKRRAHEIFNTKGMEEKVALYADLLKVTSSTLQSLEQAEIAVRDSCTDVVKQEKWQSEVNRFKPSIQGIIDQTQRRIFNEEKVPAEQKIFSLFEEHTDIVIKGGREIQYGHKLNLISGKSGLILDIVIEDGNPADTDRLLPMLERHVEHYEQAPRQVAADGGYASGANLEAVKALGVADMAFNKKRGLDIVDMAKSTWVYRQLKNFRAGIESNISCLKRAYGLTRCNWKGLQHFQSFVWSSVVSYNLTVMARLLPT
jgi:IS5 family transposase